MQRMRRSVGLSVVCLGLVFAGPAVAQESQEEPQQEKAEEPEEAKPAENADSAGVKTLLRQAQNAYHAGRWYEAQLRYEDAYRDAEDESPLKVQASLGLSTLLWEQGNYGQARQYVNEALDLAEKLNLDSVIGQLLLTLGHIEASQGSLQDAEQTLRLCVKLASEQKDAIFSPLCKLNHRLVRKLQGEKVGSEAEYKKTLKKLEEVDSPLTVGMSLAKTAELYAKGGQTGRAFKLVDEADQQYARAKSVPARARNRMLKARLLQDADKWDAARQELKGLLAKFRDMGSKPALIDTHGLLGNDARTRGEFGKAHAHYAKALKLAEETGSPQLVAKVQLAMCEVSSKVGGSGFETVCSQSVKTFANLGMPTMEAQARSAYARYWYARNKLDEARGQFIEAIKVRREEVHGRLRNEKALAHDMANLCQVEMRKQTEGAFYRCRKTLKVLKEAAVDEPTMLASTHYALGTSAVNEGHGKEALEHLQKAIELYDEIEPRDVARIADALLRKGVVLMKSGEKAKAAATFEDGLERIEKTGKPMLSARIPLRTQYAQLQLNREKWKSAATELETLIEEAKKAGKLGKRAWAWSALASVRNELGDDKGARKALEKALPLAKEAGDEGLVKTIEENLKQFE